MRADLVAPAAQGETTVGVLEITTTGRGYVVCDDLDEDVMVENRYLNKGRHGDKVEVFVGEKKKKEKILRFDKKENPFNKLLSLNIK